VGGQVQVLGLARLLLGRLDEHGRNLDPSMMGVGLAQLARSGKQLVASSAPCDGHHDQSCFHPEQLQSR